MITLHNDFLTIQINELGAELHKTHTVTNTGLNTLYFEIGGHDAFAIPFLDGESMDMCRVAFQIYFIFHHTNSRMICCSSHHSE